MSTLATQPRHHNPQSRILTPDAPDARPQSNRHKGGNEMVLPRRSLSLETAAMVHWLACKRGFWAACYWLDHLNCMLPVRREVHQIAANASFSIQIRHDGALIRGIGRERRLRGAWSRQAIPARLLWGLDRKHRDDFHAAAKLRWAHWLRGRWAHWSIGRCSQSRYMIPPSWGCALPSISSCSSPPSLLHLCCCTKLPLLV